MRKKLAIMLVLVMLFGLLGCNAQSAYDPETSSNVSSENTEQHNTEANIKIENLKIEIKEYLEILGEEENEKVYGKMKDSAIALDEKLSQYRTKHKDEEEFCELIGATFEMLMDDGYQAFFEIAGELAAYKVEQTLTLGLEANKDEEEIKAEVYDAVEEILSLYEEYMFEYIHSTEARLEEIISYITQTGFDAEWVRRNSDKLNEEMVGHVAEAYKEYVKEVQKRYQLNPEAFGLMEKEW